MKVKDAMTRSVSACGPDDPTSRAAQLMWEGDLGCVAVVDDSGRVSGVITDRDICMAAYTQGLRLDQIPVRRAMSTVVHTCGPEDSIESALALMRRNKIRRLPVTDGGRPVGILSVSDVMRVLRASQMERRLDGTHGDVFETLVVISEPGSVAAKRSQAQRESPSFAEGRRN